MQYLMISYKKYFIEFRNCIIFFSPDYNKYIKKYTVHSSKVAPEHLTQSCYIYHSDIHPRNYFAQLVALPAYFLASFLIIILSLKLCLLQCRPGQISPLLSERRGLHKARSCDERLRCLQMYYFLVLSDFTCLHFCSEELKGKDNQLQREKNNMKNKEKPHKTILSYLLYQRIPCNNFLFCTIAQKPFPTCADEIRFLYLQ